jgi:hypothetical protein
VALAVQQQLSETTRTIGNLPASIAVYWHLLSLDAPTVAALWSWSFARAMHITLPPLTCLLMAIGTWLVYVADRLLDGMGSGNNPHLRVRHHFYSRHRRLFFLSGILVCPLFLWIVFTRMTDRVRREEIAVFILAVLYFLLVHVRSRYIEHRLPKELAVGVLFAAATAVPTWARIAGSRIDLLPALAVFAVLCWLNCVAIENWERTSRMKATAHITTLWAGRHLQSLTAGVALLAAMLALTTMAMPVLSCLHLASAAAALLLLWLARHDRRLSTMQLRIAADAALLTPLFFLLWAR